MSLLTHESTVQSGFAMVCAGAIRKKNMQNSMLKNLVRVGRRDGRCRIPFTESHLTLFNTRSWMPVEPPSRTLSSDTPFPLVGPRTDRRKPPLSVTQTFSSRIPRTTPFLPITVLLPRQPSPLWRVLWPVSCMENGFCVVGRWWRVVAIVQCTLCLTKYFTPTFTTIYTSQNAAK